MEFSDDGADDPLNDAIFDVNRLHRAVGWLEADAVAFAIESFQRRERIIEQGHDHFAISWRRVALDDNIIPAENAVLNHGLPFDAQHERVGAIDHELRRHGHGLFLLDSLDREAGRDESDKREND